MSGLKAWPILRLVLLVPLTLLIALFHGFVGANKALAPREVLVEHTAWTIHLPDAVGRAVGWLELGLTASLLIALLRPASARLGMWACLALVALEGISSFVHYRHGELAMVPQNATSVLLTTLAALLFARRRA